MNFFQKFRDFVLHPTHSRTIALLVLLVLVSAISLTVIVAQQQQQLKQKAADSSGCLSIYNDANLKCDDIYNQCYSACQQDILVDFNTCSATCDNNKSSCKQDAAYQYQDCLRTTAPTSSPGTCLRTGNTCIDPDGSYTDFCDASGSVGSEFFCGSDGYCRTSSISCPSGSSCSVSSSADHVVCDTDSPTATPTSTQYTLSGHVFVDTNKSGMLDNGESDYVGAINLILSSTNGGIINSISSTDTITTSEWSRLVTAADYKLTLTVPSGYTATTQTSLLNSVSENISGLNFGIAPLTSASTNTPISAPIGTKTAYSCTKTEYGNLVWNGKCDADNQSSSSNYCSAKDDTHECDKDLRYSISCVSSSDCIPTNITPTSPPVVPNCPINDPNTKCTTNSPGSNCVVYFANTANCPSTCWYCSAQTNITPTGTAPANNVTLTLILNYHPDVLDGGFANGIPVELSIHNPSAKDFKNGTPIGKSSSFSKVSPKKFSAPVPLTNIAPNQYLLIARQNDPTIKSIGNNLIAKTLFTLTAGQTTITAPETTLVLGDINNDNDINIGDYNTFKTCYKKNVISNPECIPSNLNNDDSSNTVNQFDYNAFLRGFAFWNTEGK